MRDLINRMSEVGWLFHRVNDFLHSSNETSAQALATNGLVAQVSPLLKWSNSFQSFCSAVQQELSDYYRLIAVLESQIASSSNTSNLTLRRLFVWIQEPLQRLKLLAMFVDSARERAKGGALISALRAYVNHGSPSIKSFVNGLMTKVSHQKNLFV